MRKLRPAEVLTSYSYTWSTGKKDTKISQTTHREGNSKLFSGAFPSYSFILFFLRVSLPPSVIQQQRKPDGRDTAFVANNRAREETTTTTTTTRWREREREREREHSSFFFRGRKK